MLLNQRKAHKMRNVRGLTLDELDRIVCDATTLAREEALNAGLAISGIDEHGLLVTATARGPVQRSSEPRKQIDEKT
jgi:hypothetical protein